jgi:DNA (cytosine-5)-methyltransferase 1
VSNTPQPLIVDMFAGGGGASTGIHSALGRSPDIAIDHNAEAVAMHAKNHTTTRHYCADVWDVDPVKLCADQPVGLAWFSPDCKHFSRAKNGKPVERKVRGLAWLVIRWARHVSPRVIVLENVEEFQTWGPLQADGLPCLSRRGETYQHWLTALRKRGYVVEARVLRACDYGAPTGRKRLFVIARNDGAPIVWPTPTHGPMLLKRYGAAADCIDWTLPTPSIFGRPKPLVDATLRRIARGIQRFVVDASKPFIAPVTATFPPTNVDSRAVSAFLVKHYGGNYIGAGLSMLAPLDTVTTVDHHALVVSTLVKLRGQCAGADIQLPAPTITAGGTHLAEVRVFLATHVLTPQSTKPIWVHGDAYQITDIGMRMLTPRELARAQGFPDSYVIDFNVKDKPLSKTAQVRMIGNAVCPPIAAAIVAANYTT